MEFDAYVRSLGLDPTALSPELHKALETSWRASQKVPPPLPVAALPAALPLGLLPTHGPAPTAPAAPGTRPPTQAELDLEVSARTAEAENHRRSDIVALCQRFMVQAPDRVKEFQDYAKLAIDGGLTAKDAELEFLRRSYGRGPLAYSPSQAQVDDGVIEVAVARAMGVKRETIERDYGDKTLTTADKSFRGGCGLQQLIVLCARSNGLRDASTDHFRVSMASTISILRAAFGRAQGDDYWQAGAAGGFGPSTYNLSGILSNVMNKSIRDYFNAVEQVWRLLTATRPVNDFKQITGYALTGDLTYKLVAPGGDVKHGTLGEETYSNQARLYALMLGIDYQQLRNDDLGAFQQINKRLGRGGALTINDIFWEAFLTTVGAFWSGANGNYAAATDYAFSLANLRNVNTAWQARTDPNGKPMGDRAKYLLTPTKLEIDAKKFMRSSTVSNDAGAGSDNPLAGQWEPISSTYLSNANFTGNSADNYYLVKDPNDMPVIETVFLDGQEMPTIEMAEPDLDKLGIAVRGMHAFGCQRQEKRGGFKFKPTAD